MKNVLVGAKRKIGIPGVIELVIKIELRNKKKVKVDDGMDILVTPYPSVRHNMIP